MISIAVVEDDQEYQKQLLQYIEQYGKEIAGNTESVTQTIHWLQSNPAPDLIFMDIAMPHMDGLETAAALRKRGDNTCLIFITSMAQYALKGYEVNAFDFLVKPLAYELFCIKFEKALSHIDRSEAYYIKIPNGAKKVSPGQITYIESNKHYLEFHVHGDVYKMRGTMKEIQEYFLASHFALVNSSILVNLSMVDEWKGNEIKAAGQTFVLSQKYKKEFLDRLTLQMGQ